MFDSKADSILCRSLPNYILQDHSQLLGVALKALRSRVSIWFWILQGCPANGYTVVETT
jgi:hypothetical protein